MSPMWRSAAGSILPHHRASTRDAGLVQFAPLLPSRGFSHWEFPETSNPSVACEKGCARQGLRISSTSKPHDVSPWRMSRCPPSLRCTCTRLLFIGLKESSCGSAGGGRQPPVQRVQSFLRRRDRGRVNDRPARPHELWNGQPHEQARAVHLGPGSTGRLGTERPIGALLGEAQALTT